jgi:hypothetical protein
MSYMYTVAGVFLLPGSKVRVSANFLIRHLYYLHGLSPLSDEVNLL